MYQKSIKIAVLGDEGSGKSSLVHRFAHNEYKATTKTVCTCPKTVKTRAECGNHLLSDVLERGDRQCANLYDTGSTPLTSGTHRRILPSRCTCHRSSPEYRSVVWEGPSKEINLMHVSVLDIPALKSFPADTLEEFASEEARGVRTASVFILVFDVTNRESFEYISRIRNQIRKCWFRRTQSEILYPSLLPWKGSPSEDIPAITTKRTRSIRRNHRIYRKSNTQEEVSVFSVSSSSSDFVAQGALNGDSVDSLIVVVGTKMDLLFKKTQNVDNGYIYESQISWYKNTVNTIKKTWKHTYLDCSAKYGFNVQAAFLAAVDGALVARGKRKKTRVKKSRDICM
ncbi:uncharacterized protein LOC120348375 [Styela clava]